jgi:hypothetical protein
MESKIDQSLIEAYKNTNYRILEPNVSILLNQKNPILDQWLEEKNLSTWAFITAFNPYSILLPDEKNLQAGELLKEKISSLGFAYFEGTAESVKDDFPAENSAFIMGIPKNQAMELAKEFEQNAFLFGTVSEISEILFTE